MKATHFHMDTPEHITFIRKKIPFITVEVGRGAAPLGGGEFGSIWAKIKNVVIREAQLFQ